MKKGSLSAPITESGEVEIDEKRYSYMHDIWL